MTREALKLALEALEIEEAQTHYPSQWLLKAITAIKEALAQPEQEPVATIDDLEQEIYENTRQFVSHDVMEWMLKRYYTTPPQHTWVGLTDEEKADLFASTAPYYNEVDYADAIEAKLKEKNT